jgi:predicted ATP-grasp superfamily ATP-dependent carboligase
MRRKIKRALALRGIAAPMKKGSNAKAQENRPYMNIIATIVAAVVGMLGVMVGATLQYLYGKRAETSKQLQTLKNQAYVDFVKSVAGMASAQRFKNKEKEFEVSILLADARARIAVYGSKEVIEGIAAFYRTHGLLATPEAMSSFVEVIQKMRKQAVDKDESISDKELSQLLFGTD